MTYVELMAERMNAALMAQRDQVLFGAGYTKSWIDEEGNPRLKHIQILEVEINRDTGEIK